MLEISRFQDAFGAALEGRAEALSPWLESASDAPGLAVYRNTVATGAIDALAAIYETVVQLVGDEWFRAAAGAYARDHPPQRPALMDYGADFPDWLADFPPAQDIPYAADLARLDGLRNEAYFAADAEALPPTAFAGLSAGDLAETRARLHPSARLIAFRQSIVSLWFAHRDPAGLAPLELEDRAERALVIRSVLAVEVRLLSAPTWAFLAACAEGRSLLGAAEAALAADPTADFAKIVAEAFDADAFAGLEPVMPREGSRYDS